VADAGPLIALASIGAIELLRQLFGRVCITNTIRDEILPAGCVSPDADLLVRSLEQGWIEVVEMPPSDHKLLNPGVDSGEASAIEAACNWRDGGAAVLLLMDDRAGRLEAKSRGGIALIGTAALIGLAKTEGLVAAALPLLERLVASGYFIGPSIVSAVLSDIDE